jgi:hypothetical protein
MKADIKTKWVAALRSGEYEQTEGVLRNGNGFCCLGVLCDLYAQETGVEWAAPNEYGQSTMHKIASTLPLEVRVWAQLADEYGTYVEVETDEGGAANPYLTNASLTELNDTWNYDFKMIADVIEQQL